MYALQFRDVTARAPVQEKAPMRILHTFFPPKDSKETGEKLLDGVSFTLARGEGLMLLGAQNEVRAALEAAAQGHAGVEAAGDVRTAFGAGTELISHMTGEENARLFMELLPISRAAGACALMDVYSFSRLGAALKKPVSAYTPAMRAQLRLSLVLGVPPAVLVEDGALAKCNMDFAAACVQRIRRELSHGMAFLCAAGDAAGRLCYSALRLEDGRVKEQGSYGRLVRGYRAPRDMKAAFSAPLDVAPSARTRLAFAQSLRLMQAMLMRLRG